MKIKHFIADKIATLYRELGCTALVEIGPGKGALTKLIHHISPQFFVIERDDHLIDKGKLKVEGLEHVSVIHSDVLEVDVVQQLTDRGCTPDKTLVVGNLPYYITSPIFRKFFGYGKQEFAGGVFMIQKEVADKIKTDADKKSYLWRLLNYAYQVDYLKNVPPKAFKPAPKVTSAVIGIKSHEGDELLRYARNDISFDDLIAFLDDFAPYSRKTLGAIATMIKKKGGKIWDISEDIRGKRLEEVDWKGIEKILT